MRAFCVGLFLLALGAPSLPAQQSSVRTAAALDPDSVRVGEPFILGLSVAGPLEAPATFPPLITLDPELEQLRPPEIEWHDERGGSWRAHYRLSAWKAGDWELPAIGVAIEGREVQVRPPAIHVTSVLPAEADGPLQLKPPREPIPHRPFPWWLLLLLLALALLWWLLRRLHGVEEEEAEEPVDPAVAAREALAALKEDLEQGRLDVAAFYDGLEGVLRSYLAATRGWPEERPVREFVETGAVARASRELRVGLRSMRDRAGLVRFAHVTAAEPAALDDADACLAWVEAEEEAA
jgi:hypothetical protein